MYMTMERRDVPRALVNLKRKVFRDLRVRLKGTNLRDIYRP